MRKLVRAGALVPIVALAIPGFAAAATMATATADLNVRSGPGPQYDVIGLIGQGNQASVQGCIEGGNWCQVDVGGTTGWAYAGYLQMASAGGGTVVLSDSTAAVPSVTHQGGGGTVAGAAGGAITGALIGGPIGAAVGGVAGAALGTAVDPPQQVQTYVVENRAEPVYLDGEVVVGAGVPDTVTLQPIPDYQYRYVYVNQQPVLVDPITLRIVYVFP